MPQVDGPYAARSWLVCVLRRESVVWWADGVLKFPLHILGCEFDELARLSIRNPRSGVQEKD